MRAAPPFQVSVRRFGVWRVAVGLLAGVALGAVVAWAASHSRPIGVPVWAGAAVGVLIVALVVVAVVRQRPIELRWDGQAWQLGTASARPTTGELGVALDLGSWMLLRFEPAASRVPVWVPVQRRGLEPSWHALRCAVHASQRAADDPMIGAG